MTGCPSGPPSGPEPLPLRSALRAGALPGRGDDLPGQRTGQRTGFIMLIFWDKKAKGMEHNDITEKIIGCACKVYNKKGFGFLESAYEKCLLLELYRAVLKTELTCIADKAQPRG